MSLHSLAEHSTVNTSLRVKEAALQFEEALTPLLELPIVHDIRGPGLMKGIELRHADGSLAGEVAIGAVISLLKEGLILLPDAPEGHVIALTPPFDLSREEMDFTVEKLRAALIGHA